MNPTLNSWTLTWLSWTALSLVPQAVQAQTPTPSAVREQVRKDAAAANKADKIEHGEVDHTAPVPPVRRSASGVTTSSVRKEAVAANKAGMTEQGEMGSAAAHPKGKPTSERSKAEVKKEAVVANKSGQTPHGEVEPNPKR